MVAAQMLPALSPGEWAVLGVVAEGPTHGFAVAQVLAPDGELGRVWSVPRPVVYQVLKKLLQRGLVAAPGTVASDRGPVRIIVEVTPAGRAALSGWLAAPVDHVRDVRSMLLLKLAFLERAGLDRRGLVAAQRARLAAQVVALEAARSAVSGFDRVLLDWRLTSSRATSAFLETLDAPQ